MTLQSLVFMPWWGAYCHGREPCGFLLSSWALTFGIVILVSAHCHLALAVEVR